MLLFTRSHPPISSSLKRFKFWVLTPFQGVECCWKKSITIDYLLDFLRRYLKVDINSVPVIRPVTSGVSTLTISNFRIQSIITSTIILVSFRLSVWLIDFWTNFVNEVSPPSLQSWRSFISGRKPVTSGISALLNSKFKKLVKWCFYCNRAKVQVSNCICWFLNEF